MVLDKVFFTVFWGFQSFGAFFDSSILGKESTCNAGDPSAIPGLRRSPGEGNGNPFQYSCLGNPIDREAWWATVHEVPKSLTGLSTHSQHEFNSPGEVVNNADCCR